MTESASSSHHFAFCSAGSVVEFPSPLHCHPGICRSSPFDLLQKHQRQISGTHFWCCTVISNKNVYRRASSGDGQAVSIISLSACASCRVGPGYLLLRVL